MPYYSCRNDVITKLVRTILLLLVLLIPIINLNEIKWFLGMSMETNRGGFFYIKYIKDVGFILIILLSLIRRTKMVAPWPYKFLPFIVILLIVHILFSIDQTSFTLLCGLRWFLPLILFIFLYEFIDEKFLKVISKCIYAMFLLHFILQIIECFVMPPYNGTTYFGLSGRVPGLFSHAHAGASFTCLTFILGYVFLKKRSKFFWISICLSILLTMSSTGIITIIILFVLLHFSKTKYFKKLLIIVPILAVILYRNADVLTNRQSGSSESSLGTRQEIVMKTLANSDIISTDFGLATNAANTVSASNKAFIADSFYTSVIGNLGILPMFILIVFILYSVYYNLKRHKYYVVSVVIFYALFSISTIVTEVYPLNLFIAIFFVYAYKHDISLMLSRNVKI